MKKFYFDVETTGLDSRLMGIIQLSALVEVDGKVVDELDLKIRPFEGCIYDKEALKVNNKTKDEILTFKDEATQFKALLKFLNKHVDKKIYEDSLTMVGYNVAFDVRFLEALFGRNRHFNFMNYFNYRSEDVLAFVRILDLKGDDGRQKLGSICEKMGMKIDGELHDALTDIKVTRKLYKKLRKKYLK